MDTLRPSEIANMIKELKRRLTHVGLCLSGDIASAKMEIAKGTPFTHMPLADNDTEIMVEIGRKSKTIAEWLIDNVREDLMLRLMDLCQPYKRITDRLAELSRLGLIDYADGTYYDYYNAIASAQDTIGFAIESYPQLWEKWQCLLEPAGNDQQSHAVEAAQDTQVPQEPDGKQLIAEVPQAPDANLSYITLGGKRIELDKSLRKPIVHSMLKKAYDLGDIGITEDISSTWLLVNQFKQKNRLAFFAKVICGEASTDNKDWKNLFHDQTFNQSYANLTARSNNIDDAKEKWDDIKNKNESEQKRKIAQLTKQIRWMVEMLKRYS